MASSDELLDDTNADIPPESEDKSKTEFLNRVKKIKSEIKTKFQNVRKKLDEKELKILKKVEEIEKEIMDDYEKHAITLKEITQAKEHLLSTFKRNTTNILLRKNLEILDKEIEEIKKNYNIESTIELVWKMDQLDLSRDDMCEVSINIKSSLPKMPSQTHIPTNQAEGGNVFGAGEPNNFMSQQLPPPHPQTQQLPQGQSQQFPPLSQQQNQQNPGQIPHGQPDRSGQMPSQMPPENPAHRDLNVQTQESHQMLTNSLHPQSYFIRPRQMPNEVTQLHKCIRGILEKHITISLHNTIPGELTYVANQCVKLAAQDKYSHSIVCEIIIASLNKNKPIKDVEAGLNRLALFTLNILTNAVNLTCKVFQDGAGYFGNEISSRLSLASNILPFLGYTYDSSNRSNVLSNERLGMPGTTETLILIAADLLMAENDIKTFHKLGPAELIRFYELYPPTLPQTPEMPSYNMAPQTQSPQTSGNQAQYSSTHTNPGPSSDVPPQQSLRRILEGRQYNTGASVPQSTTHAYSPGMQSQRQNEPNPNNFNVTAHLNSAYNHPRTYPQNAYNAPMMYPQTGRDVPSGIPFQQMQNQPVGLNPPSGASGWACPHCTFVNSSHSRVCEACARTPNSKVDQPAVQDIQSQTSQKRCRNCDRMNRMQEAVCIHCNTSFV